MGGDYTLSTTILHCSCWKGGGHSWVYRSVVRFSRYFITSGKGDDEWFLGVSWVSVGCFP